MFSKDNMFLIVQMFKNILRKDLEMKLRMVENI